MSKLKSGRINLDEGAIKALSLMLDEISGEAYTKVNSATLGSWIIKEFHKTFYKRSKKKMVKEHYDSKTYLQQVIKGLTGEKNAEEVLRTALNNLPSRASYGLKELSDEQKK